MFQLQIGNPRHQRLFPGGIGGGLPVGTRLIQFRLESDFLRKGARFGHHAKAHGITRVDQRIAGALWQRFALASQAGQLSGGFGLADARFGQAVPFQHAR